MIQPLRISCQNYQKRKISQYSQRRPQSRHNCSLDQWLLIYCINSYPMWRETLYQGRQDQWITSIYLWAVSRHSLRIHWHWWVAHMPCNQNLDYETWKQYWGVWCQWRTSRWRRLRPLPSDTCHCLQPSPLDESRWLGWFPVRSFWWVCCCLGRLLT